MKNTKIYLPLAILLVLANCKKEYQRPDKYSQDLFAGKDTSNLQLTVEQASQQSEAIIETQNFQLLDSKKDSTHSLYIYRIEQGNIKKNTKDSLQIPLTILSQYELKKSEKPKTIYLEKATSFQLLTKQFNINYKTVNNAPQ